VGRAFARFCSRMDHQPARRVIGVIQWADMTCFREVQGGHPWRRIGYEAANLLDRMLEGEQIVPRIITVPPICVVERQSTDSIAVSDPEVGAAVRHIREHAHERTTVEDVRKVVPFGRRSLEKRFRASLDRSPLEEIRRVHIERANQLLEATDLSINDVARRSGFGGSTWFTEAFHDLVGESPAQYRKRYHRA